MAKTEGPLFGDWASGEVANILAYKKGRPFTSAGDEDEIPYGRIEKKRRPGKKRTARQEIVRENFKEAKNQWRELTEEEKNNWKQNAPNPWTGYNYFLNVALRGYRYWFSEIIFYEDVFKQGNIEGQAQEIEYENNFPNDLDYCPLIQDGADNFQAWLFNKIALSIKTIQTYLIYNKKNIEKEH